MDWRPGQGNRPGGGADPDPGLPGGPDRTGAPARVTPDPGTSASPGASDGPSVPVGPNFTDGPGLPPRDDRLAGFAPGGEWDARPPSAALAAALEGASGEDWRCPGATRGELIGLLRQWAALESRAAAGKLGVLRG